MKYDEANLTKQEMLAGLKYLPSEFFQVKATTTNPETPQNKTRQAPYHAEWEMKKPTFRGDGKSPK